jgi:hypothetical protein
MKKYVVFLLALLLFITLARPLAGHSMDGGSFSRFAAKASQVHGIG